MQVQFACSTYDLVSGPTMALGGLAVLSDYTCSVIGAIVFQEGFSQKRKCGVVNRELPSQFAHVDAIGY